MTRLLYIAAVVAGCMPTVEPTAHNDSRFESDALVDTGAGTDTGQSLADSTQLLLSTIASDYSLGAVATLDLQTGVVADALATTSGDAVVRSSGGLAIVLNRLNTDSVRVYDGDDWSTPMLEFALEDLSNPQDAVLCDGKLWVTQHNAARITAHDPETGLIVDAIDLSPWAGSDGAAEASGMVRNGESVLVVVQQFDQDAGWVSEGGQLVQFPCEGGEPAEVTAIGPSPSIASGSSGPDVVVRTGLYGAIDGVIAEIDVSTGAQTVLTSEADVGRDITSVAVSDRTVVFLSTDADWIYQVHCVDRGTGLRTDGPQSAEFWADVVIDDRDRVWIAARAGWASDTPERGGLRTLNADTCRDTSPGGEPIRTSLDPYNLAVQ